jgi:hypothetical protein
MEPKVVLLKLGPMNHLENETSISLLMKRIKWFLFLFKWGNLTNLSSPHPLLFTRCISLSIYHFFNQGKFLFMYISGPL